jgi:hypothetical protein
VGHVIRGRWCGVSAVGVWAGLLASVAAGCGDESLVTLFPSAELSAGEQVSPPLPVVSLAVDVPRGGTRDVTVVLRNAGASDLVVQRIEVGADVDACPQPRAQAVVIDSPASVPPGLGAPITLSLAPDADDGCVALHVTTNDPDHPVLTAVVDFEVLADFCAFDVDAIVDFGAAPVGLSRVEAVMVHSTGTIPCTFSLGVVDGYDAFTLIDDHADAVPPGVAHRFNVLFSPAAEGRHVGTLQVFAGDAVRSVTLRGTGRAPVPTEEAEPSADCRGVTWVLHETRDGLSHVGSDETTNAYAGDTSCDVELPVLCLHKSWLPAPEGMTFDFYNGWTGGDVALTAPVAGHTLTSRDAADALCARTFGAGFAMGEHHDGGGGWHWWARGTLSTTSRFWATVDNQPSSPWSTR